MHFKAAFSVESSRHWTSYRREPSPPGQCPVLFLRHLFKAGGNSVISLMDKVGLCRHSLAEHSCEGVKVVKGSEGDICFVDHVDSGSETTLPPYRIGMVRAPCEYLLSVWAFQRSLGEMPLECSHVGEICRCVERYKPPKQRL